MLKKRNFWAGLVIGILIGFLYGWLSIWATYISLERAERERTEELRQIKCILFLNEDIDQEREEAIEWNQQAIKPAPTKASDNE